MAFGRKSPMPVSKSQEMVTELSVKRDCNSGRLALRHPIPAAGNYLYPFLCFSNEVIVLFDHQHRDPKLM